MTSFLTFTEESVFASENNETRRLESVENITKQQNIVLNTTQRLYFFGDAELASVEITPNRLRLNNLQLLVAEQRVLLIKNLSENLPITVRYAKIPYVKIYPEQLTLKPCESIEVQVIVTPSVIGKVIKHIGFDLLYRAHKNVGYTVVGNTEIPFSFKSKAITKTPAPKCPLLKYPFTTNAVGFMAGDVKFNSSAPSRTTTIVSKKPLHSIKTDEKLKKIKKKDYELTNKKMLLLTDMKCEECTLVKCKEEKHPSFIPLTASELYKIKIFPRHIKIGKVCRGFRYHGLLFTMFRYISVQ